MPDTDTRLTLPNASTGRGPSWTLNDLRKNPTWLPQIVYKMAENMFIAEYICRKGPPATSGSIAFREAEPLFADVEPEVIAEYGEYPSTDFHTGGLIVRATTKRGFGIRMSQEMLDDNDTATFTRNTKQAVNTMRRAWDRTFFAGFKNHPRIASMPSSLATVDGGWNNVETTLPKGTGIRRDVANAIFELQHHQRDGEYDEWLETEPDTLIVHPLTLTSWIDNDELNKVFLNSPAVTEAPRYKFLFPKRFFNLNIVSSFEMPVNEDGIPSAALLLQRNETAFISDKRAFRVTPMYEEKKNESWRSDMSRISTMGVDNPYSALWITDIDGTG